jgi:uncharacterized protein YkwD
VNKPTRRAAVTAGCVAVAAAALSVGLALASTAPASTARLASNPLASTSNPAPSPRRAGGPTVLPPTVPGSVTPSSTPPSSSVPVVIPPAPAPAPARQNAATVVPVANSNNGGGSSKKSTTKKVAAPACKTGSGSSYPERSDIASAIYSQINSERSQNGLAALGRSSQLNSSAHGHNVAMANTGDFAHQVPCEASLGARISATGYHWSSAGENIAWGSNASVSFGQSLETEMYNEPPNQPNHRANILSTSFHNVGVDVIVGSDGKMWITCDFGS